MHHHYRLLNAKEEKGPEQQHAFDKLYGLTVYVKKDL